MKIRRLSQPTKIRRFASAAVLIAAVAALTAACSSTSTGKSTGTSGSEVVIGSLGAYSGAFASTEGGIPQVTAAWASTVNANGGLDGHHVRVITGDIGNTTGADLTAAKELIDQDHVVAIVIALTSAGAATSPDAFPISYSESALGYAIPSLAKTAGAKFGIVYCAEVASCGELGSIFETSAKRQGLQVPVNVKISSSAPDYTVVCQDLKSEGVNSYVVIAGGAVVTEVADQCHRQGVTAVLVQDGGQAQAAWKTDPAFGGLLVVDSFAPFFSGNTPAHKTYRDALAKYAPGVPNSSQDNSYSEAAWLDGQLISAAGKNVSGTITAVSLKQGLYALKAETLGGMIQPVTYNQGKPTLMGCYFSWSVKNGAFVASNGDKYSCVPQSSLAG